MKNKKVSDNRKAFPKFAVFLLISAIAGGVIGGFAGFLGGTCTPENIVEQIYSITETVLPYSIWITTGIFTFLEVRLYRQSAGIFRNWDGEDESLIEQAEEKLSWIILFSSVNLILVFFFFGAEEIINRKYDTGLFAAVIIPFVLSIVILFLIQQKTVDLIRKINPEKKGSIYDIHFAETWMESCDENEQRQVGQAAYKAYLVSMTCCIVLWFLAIISSKVFNTGLMPVFITTFIWAAGQITFCYESIRLGRGR